MALASLPSSALRLPAAAESQRLECTLPGVEPATESAAGSADAAGTCDSCGQPAEDLAAVHRAYLTPDDASELVLGEVADDVERWCGSCRSHYPHVPAGG
jgi:hypothetical protein